MATNSFTVGDTIRYVQATYFVRNAQLDGTACDTDGNNLTFLAVSADRTTNQTTVRRFLRADGSPADPVHALELLPTGKAEADGDGGVTSLHPDVLQVLTEAQAAGILQFMNEVLSSAVTLTYAPPNTRVA